MTTKDWRLIIAGYVILTVFWLVGAGWTFHLQQQTEDTLDGVKANQGRIGRLVTETTTLICTTAEGDEASDARVMEQYASGQAITGIPPICLRVGDVARGRILGLTDNDNDLSTPPRTITNP